MRLGLALALALALAAGCKKKQSEAPVEPVAKAEPAAPVAPTPDEAAALAKLREAAEALATRACACKDDASCLRGAEIDRAMWKATIVQPGTAGTKLKAALADAAVQASLTRLDACLAATAPRGSATTAERTELPETYEGDVALARLLHDAKAYLGEAYPDVAIVTINAQYLRASGVVDPKYGVVILETGVVPRNAPVDDPDRPTGAPVPEPAPADGPPRTQCPFLKWTANKWTEDLLSCRNRPPLVGPRCTADQIWQRAIADKAPDNAVAVLRIGIPYSDRWSFSISDTLRKVSFSRVYRDDCEPALEQPR